MQNTEFKVWKIVKHPYYWHKPPPGGCIPEGSNPAEDTIDLVKVMVEDLNLEGDRKTWNLEKAARKGKSLGLTFVPDFVLKALEVLLFAEYGENPPGPLAYAMANDFGQVFAFGFEEKRFETLKMHGILCMQCGIPKNVPLIFVKPRKQETAV